MLHRLRFSEFPPILPLPHRRVIVRYLRNLARPQQIQPRIPHMTHGHNIVLNQRDRQNAGHPVPVRARTRLPVDFVIRQRDRFPQPLFRTARLALQPLPQNLDRRFGRPLPRSMSPNAVDHRENSAVRIHVIPIFVVSAPPARVALNGRPQLCPDRHLSQRLSRSAVSSASSMTTTAIALSTTVRPVSRSVTRQLPTADRARPQG